LKHGTDASQHQDSVNSKIQALNRIVAGWCRYYQYTSQATAEFNRIQYRLFWLMGHWLGRKHKTSFRVICIRYKRNETCATSECSLLKLGDEFPTRRYRASVFKPNPYTHQQLIISREELPDEA